MSIKIGIVCEGISDYRILKHITERYLRDEDAFTIPLKPKETRQGTQDGFGSWQGVLAYIEGRDQMILEAVKEGCQYVIVHLDTDVRDQYGAPNEFTDHKELHENVMTLLINRVHPAFDKDQLIFAIAIHETECWLIPFLTDDKKKCNKSESCVNTLNNLIKGYGYIDKDNKNAEPARQVYNDILKKKKKPKDITNASLHNYGFAYFINTLYNIKMNLNHGNNNQNQDTI